MKYPRKNMNKTSMSAFILLLFVSVLTVTTSCSDDDKSSAKPTLQGKISSYNEFGAAMLDFTEADMTKAGFTLGDLVRVLTEF